MHESFWGNFGLFALGFDFIQSKIWILLYFSAPWKFLALLGFPICIVCLEDCSRGQDRCKMSEVNYWYQCFRSVDTGRCLKFTSTFILHLKQQCSASQKSTGSDWKCIFICVYAAKLLYLCLKSSSELKPWFPDLLICCIFFSNWFFAIDGGFGWCKYNTRIWWLEVWKGIGQYPVWTIFVHVLVMRRG